MERLSQDIKLEGTFGTKQIDTEFFPVPNSPNLIINIPGIFETKDGYKGKFRRLAQTLQTQLIGNVVIFDSSKLPLLSTDSPEQIIDQLKGKTFDQEIEDARRVIGYYVTNSRNLFGVEDKDLILTLNGNSLGGVIGLTLSGEFPQMQYLSTVGTGSRLNLKSAEWSALTQFPSPDQLKKFAENYRQKVMVQFGTEDEVFSSESIIELYRMFSNAQKSLCKFGYVDNSFNRLRDRYSVQPFNQVITNLELMIAEGSLSSGYISLTHEDDITRENIKAKENLENPDLDEDPYYRIDN